MKLSISTLVLLAATLAVAIERKSYIVTYDDNTPDAVVEKAIRDAISAVCSRGSCSFILSVANISMGNRAQRSPTNSVTNSLRYESIARLNASGESAADFDFK